MKGVKVKKKLALTRFTVADLGKEELEFVYGGADPSAVFTQCKYQTCDPYTDTHEKSKPCNALSQDFEVEVGFGT